MIEAQAAKHQVVIASQAMTNSVTATGNIDCKGVGYVEIEVALKSAINTNAVSPTISLLESDDTVVSNFATVVATQTIASWPAATSPMVGLFQVDTRGRKRYLRMSVSTATATNDDINVSVTARTSRKAQGPASTSDQTDVSLGVI